MCVTLKSLNTFGLNVNAHKIVIAHNEFDLLLLWKQSVQLNRPVLLLGRGSNVLFLEHYAGTVLLNRIRGISIREDDEAWYLHVGAGELWHDLVVYTLKKKIP
ncbi:MAG: FAD-binding protein, partial [Candidatus Baumannia cicadellinicola]|nr:FAD-binding protein [Candidatus Baumannia cicadellinicola]